MNKELYILGLILTDGYKYRNYYRIELKDEDKNVLEQISDDFSCSLYSRTRDTNFLKDYSSTKLIIKRENKELVSFLDKYIPNENKTLEAYVPEEFLHSPSLWRGILDGDGCYGYRGKTPFIGFVTKNEKLKDAFCQIVYDIVGQKISATRNKRDSVYNLGLTSVNAKKFIEWLLTEDTFYIPRKKNIMQSIILWEPTGRQGMRQRRWTQEEDDYVYTHTFQECVMFLDRTSDAIKNRRTKLNRERGNKDE